MRLYEKKAYYFKELVLTCQVLNLLDVDSVKKLSEIPSSMIDELVVNRELRQGVVLVSQLISGELKGKDRLEIESLVDIIMIWFEIWFDNMC